MKAVINQSGALKCLLLAGALLVFAGKAEAQSLTGSLSFTSLSTVPNFDGTTLILPPLNAINAFGLSGNFVGMLPTPFDGLTINQTTVTFGGGVAQLPQGGISDFIVFADTDDGLKGTTPSNKFVFNLASLTLSAQIGNTWVFAGTGTLTDTDSADGFPTPSAATIGFTVSGNSVGGSLTAMSVPEPSSAWLLVPALPVLLYFVRRRTA